jgi:membrane protein YdbS with pleckstrin-like domain
LEIPIQSHPVQVLVGKVCCESRHYLVAAAAIVVVVVVVVALSFGPSFFRYTFSRGALKSGME